MASADFCLPIPARYRADSTGQANRLPRVMRATFPLIPAAYTSMLSVQVSGFEDSGLLTRHDRLVGDFCSSDQHFARGFLQIPSRDGHPCRPASSSPCRACGGLSPPSHQAGTTPARMALTHHAPCRAHQRKNPAPRMEPGFYHPTVGMGRPSKPEGWGGGKPSGLRRSNLRMTASDHPSIWQRGSGGGGDATARRGLGRPRIPTMKNSGREGPVKAFTL